MITWTPTSYMHHQKWAPVWYLLVGRPTVAVQIALRPQMRCMVQTKKSMTLMSKTGPKCLSVALRR